MILVIDNYDSFTYNIVEYLKQLGEKVVVKKNDKCTIPQVKKIKPKKIIISPGPSNPRHSGNCNEIIKYFYSHISLLGVCLGNQCLAYTFGGKIITAKKIYHGKASSIFHNQKGIFQGIPQGFKAIRYHSLVIDKKTLSSEFKIIAKSEDHEIMAIQHQKYPVWGLQFHPESIGSQHGLKIMANFLKIKK